MEPVRPGLDVRTQGGFPSTEYDLLAGIGLLAPFFPAGFHHAYFSRSFWLFKLWASLLRMLAGSARGSAQRTAHPLPKLEGYTAGPVEMSVDIAVVGGGLTGLAAAREAAPYVQKIAIIERQPSLGSILSLLPDGEREEPEWLHGEEITERESIEVMTGTTAVGYYGDGLLGLVQRDCFVKLQAAQIIVASGAYEQPLLFANNDLPGIISTTAAIRLVSLYRIVPGYSTVVAVHSNQGLRTALRLLQDGLSITVIADSRSNQGGEEERQALSQAGVEYCEGYKLRKAIGRKDLIGVVLEPTADGGIERSVDCDLLVTEGDHRPANELAFHALYAGSPILEVPNRFFTLPIKEETRQVSERVYIAGAAAGACDIRNAVLQGQIAGLSAALALGKGGTTAQERRAQLFAQLRTEDRQK